MRKRFNILAVAIVLAIISFAYARYDYSNKHSVTIANTTISATGHDLFGDWMKDEMLFAIIAPIGLIAIGLAVAIKK
ncbi:MAG: hypothetical protein ABSH14_03825 [Verrucomicrobiia bacterium]|jgi:hypothetical protein